MRIWYVVGDKEYWLEPDITVTKNEKIRLWGVRLYDIKGGFKGYWQGTNMPLAVLRDLKKQTQIWYDGTLDAKKRERKLMDQLRGE